MQKVVFYAIEGHDQGYAPDPAARAICFHPFHQTVYGRPRGWTPPYRINLLLGPHCWACLQPELSELARGSLQASMRWRADLVQHLHGDMGPNTETAPPRDMLALKFYW